MRYYLQKRIFLLRLLLQLISCASDLSYLVCYQNEVAEYNPLTLNLKCNYACLTYNDACFCVENFNWTFVDSLLYTNFTCLDVSCDKNTVVVASHTYSSLCYNKDYSIVFNISKWFVSNFTENFLQILPQRSVYIFEELSLVLLADSAGSTFKYDYGDNFSVIQGSTYSSHVFTFPGQYSVKISVNSSKFANFTITKLVDVQVPLGEVSLDSCSYKLLFLNENYTQLFYCLAKVESGVGMVFEWDFNEDQKVVYNVSSSQIFTQSVPCFYECPTNVFTNLIAVPPVLSMNGTFLIPQTVFNYDSFIIGIELFAKKNSSLKLQIYQLNSQVYVLVQSFNLSLLQGFNTIRLKSKIVVLKKSVVGFWMNDMQVLQVVNSVGNSIEFFKVNSTDNLLASTYKFENVTFQVRIFASALSYIYVDYAFKLAGYHNISFYVHDRFGNAKSSNQLQVAIKSYYSVIVTDNQTKYAIATKEYSMCVSILNAALSDVVWSSKNTSVVQLVNGIEQQFYFVSQFQNNASLLVEDCHKMYFKYFGLYFINIVIQVNNIKISTVTVSIFAYPPITGLTFTFSSMNNSIFQLQPVLFKASVDPYLYPFYFTWNLGNNIFKNLSFAQLQNNYTNVYLYPGIYNITITAIYEIVFEFYTASIVVQQGYWIVGPTEMLISNLYRFDIQADTLISKSWNFSNWTFQWVYNNNISYTYRGINFIQERFNASGQQNITCKVSATGGVVNLFFIAEVYEPVEGLKIVILSRSKSINGVVISVFSMHEKGGRLNYRWMSNDFELWYTNGSIALLYSNRTGNLCISVLVTNGYFNASTSINITVIESLKFFDVFPSLQIVKTGQEVAFNISSTGGLNKTYLFYFDNNNSSIETDETLFYWKFNFSGHYQVFVSVLMNGLKSICYEYSNVPCNKTLVVHVLDSVYDLKIFYQTNNTGLIELSSDLINLVSGSPMLIRLNTTYGTNVNFELALDGIFVGDIVEETVGENTIADIHLSLINFRIAGIYQCIVIAFNQINQVQKTFYVHVYNMIKELSLKKFYFVEVFKEITFEAFVTEGTEITYQWDFGDGTDDVLINSSVVQHVFFKSGSYSASLKVFNPVSQLSSSFNIQAIIPLLNFSVSCGNTNIKTGENHLISITFTNGSYVNITVSSFDVIFFVMNTEGPYRSEYNAQFNNTGQNFLRIAASNPLNEKSFYMCNFFVSDPLINGSIDISPESLVYTNQEIKINIKIDGGTNVMGRLDIFSQNGLLLKSYPVTFSFCEYKPCNADVLQHTFVKSDHYYLICLLYNAVSSLELEKHNILVVQTLNNTQNVLELVAESAVLGNLTKVHVIFKMEFDFIECNLNFDGKQVLTIKQPLVYTYLFSDVGDYNVSIRCLSNYGYLVSWTYAHVQEEILIDTIDKPTSCVLYGETFVILFILHDINMALHIDTSVVVNSTILTPSVVITGNNISIIFSLSDYKTPDVSLFSITLFNYVSKQESFVNVCIMKPVENVASQTLGFWSFGTQVTFKISIRPEIRVSIYITFGDSFTAFISEVINDIEIFHNYTTIGTFNYTVTAYNEVSQKVYFGSIEVLEMLGQMSLKHENNLNWPERSVTFSLLFEKELQNTFQVYIQMYYNDSIANNFGLEWIPISFFDIKEKEVILTTHQYSKPGCFLVSVFVKGILNTIVLKSSVIINNVNYLDVKLTSTSHNSYNKFSLRNDYPLRIEVINGSSSGCSMYIWLIVDHQNTEVSIGNSSQPTFNIESLLGRTGIYRLDLAILLGSQLYNVSNVSFALYKGIPKVYLSMSLKTPTSNDKYFMLLTDDVDFDFPEMIISFGDTNSSITSIKPTFIALTDLSLLNDTDRKNFIDGNTIYFFLFNHFYSSSGLFLVNIFSQNEVSCLNISITVLVSESECARPIVNIAQPTSGILSFLYQNDIFIPADVNINCFYTKKAYFEWKVFESSTWEMENNVHSNGKPALSLKADLLQPSLNLERRTLSGGVYIVQVIVVLDIAGLSNSAETFVRIIEDVLQVSIAGGSLQQVPWNKSFILDASASRDPNEIDGSYSFEFAWFCKIMSKNASLNCFGNEVDQIEHFGAVWSIPKKRLMEGVQFTFKVRVSNTKRGRVAEAEQVILLLDEDIPIITIECQSNCHEPVNPSARLTLIASCSNCDWEDIVSYKWSDISEAPTLDFERDVLTQYNSSILVIKPGSLNGGKMYKMALDVTKGSGRSSHSEYHFSVNSLPSGGKCDIKPSNGTSIETIFYISCSKWTSPLGSLFYRILFKTAFTDGVIAYQLLSYGPKESYELILPHGRKEDNYLVNITVEVEDIYQTFTTVELQTQVYPFASSNNAEVQKWLLIVTSGESNTLETYSGKGNNKVLSQLITSVCLMLHELYLTENVNASQLADQKKIKASMLEVLSEVNIGNVNDLEQTSDVLVYLLEKPEDISISSQNLTVGIFEEIYSFLESSIVVNDAPNPEKVEFVLSGLVKAAGNFINVVMKNNAINGKSADSENSVLGNQLENVTKVALQIIDKVVPAFLAGKVVGEPPIRIESKTIAFELARQTSLTFPKVIMTLNGGSILLSDQVFDFGNQSIVIDFKMLSLLKNPFIFHPSADGISAAVSNLMMMKHLPTVSQNNSLINELKDDVNLFITQKGLSSNISINSSMFLYKTIIVYQLNTSKIGVAFVCKLNIPNNQSFQLLFKRNEFPTEDNYDDIVSYNSTNNYTVFKTIDNISSYYIGVMSKNRSAVLKDDVFQVDLEVLITGCLFWDAVNNLWSNKGCRVGQLTTSFKTHCQCNHLTWFGSSSFFVSPNQLDIKHEILALRNVKDYPALLATFCTLLGVFVLALIWARRRDQLDLLKRDPVVLTSSFGSFFYHIAIYTGHRFGSGTTATPSLIISGRFGDSRPLKLTTDQRKLFERGSVDTFLYATNLDIGEINYCTVWHDDCGKKPSWFLSRIVITVLSDPKQKQYIFFCNNWLTLDFADGSLIRTLPVASNEEKKMFENIFLAKTARELTDGHIWFSIFYMPPRSNFSRIQRLSCCLCLLLTTMLTNAMFYNVGDKLASGNEVNVGNFMITWSQIIVGFQSSLIVLPINLLLVFLFRCGRLDSPNQSKTRNCLKNKKSPKQDNFFDNTDLAAKFSEPTPTFPLNVSGNVEGFEAAVAMSSSCIKRHSCCEMHQTNSLLMNEPPTENVGNNKTILGSLSSVDSANAENGSAFTNKLFFNEENPEDFKFTNKSNLYNSSTTINLYLDRTRSSNVKIEEYLSVLDVSTQIDNDFSNKAFQQLNTPEVSSGYIIEKSVVDSMCANFQSPEGLSIGTTELDNNVMNIGTTELDNNVMNIGTTELDNNVMNIGVMLNSTNETNFFSKDGGKLPKGQMIVKIFLNKLAFLFTRTNHGPSWFIYVAWFLCVASCFTSAFFTLLYGLSFGRIGQEKWLLSFFTSVFSDIVINQPLKLIIIAALVTFFVKEFKDEYIISEIENFKKNGILRKLVFSFTMGSISKENLPAPPTASYIAQTRLNRLNESKMVKVLIEIVTFLIYVGLCLLIAYGRRDPHAYLMTKSMKDIFAKNKFDQINTIPKFWTWAYEALIPGLLGTNWNSAETKHQGFLSDQVTWLVGTGQIRQLRTKRGLCLADSYYNFKNMNCSYPYIPEHEDTTLQYCDGWKQCDQNKSALYPRYWQYRTYEPFGGYKTSGLFATYSNGGYVVEIQNSKHEFASILEYLYNNTWIDGLSRAIIVQFTVYNTQANFYVVVELLLELPETGAVFTSSQFRTTRLDNYSSGFSIFLGTCEILFLAFTIGYICIELKKGVSLKWVYFKDWRNWLELISFSLICAAVGLILVRFVVVNKAKMQYFDCKEVYVNFNNAALYDQIYGNVVAIIAGVTLLKFLKLLRFNKKMSIMIQTLAHASRGLMYFAVPFSVLFLAYGQLSFLLFKNNLENFSTLLATFFSLFNIILGNYDARSVIDANYILGPIFFLSYAFLMLFILRNMFISIIIDAFSTVRQELLDKKNKYDLLDFVSRRLRILVPFGCILDNKGYKSIKKFVSVGPDNKQKRIFKRSNSLSSTVNQAIPINFSGCSNSEILKSRNKSLKFALMFPETAKLKDKENDSLTPAFEKLLDYIENMLCEEELETQLYDKLIKVYKKDNMVVRI